MVEEWNERTGTLQLELEELRKSRTSCQTELADLKRTYQKTLDKEKEKTQDLQNKLNASRKQYQSEKTESARDRAGEVCALKAEHAYELAKLNQNHERELINCDRDCRVQLEATVQSLLEDFGRNFFELERECTANLDAMAEKLTKLEARHFDISAKLSTHNEECRRFQTTMSNRDSTIQDLRFQLEETRKREIELRSERDDWNSKWLSTGAEGEEMERELRDAKKCNESLCKELKVDLGLRRNLRW